MYRHNRGLTLMELVVVLVILVALGGIVVQLLPNLLTKTHVAAAVTNITDINKSVLGFSTLNLKYPDQFDSLVNTAAVPAIYTKAPFRNAQFNGNPIFVVAALTAGEADSLVNAGITNLVPMNDLPANATFDAYEAPIVLAAVATAANVVTVRDDYVLQTFNIPTKANSRIVAFGLGPKCTLVGSTNYGIFEAPVGFAETESEQPSKAYQRFVVMFRIFDDGSRAEYLGAAHGHTDGLSTASEHIEEFYN